MTTAIRNEEIDHVDEKEGATSHSTRVRILSGLGLFLAVISFLDLASHTSSSPVLLGRYSLPLFGGVIALLGGCLLWVWSILSPRPSNILNVLLSLYKESPFHGIMSVGVFSFFIWFFGRWTRFEEFRLVQIAAIGYCIGAVCIVLFPLSGKGKVWRGFIVLLFALVIGAELVLQGLALTNRLDLNIYRGLSTPYGRIYLDNDNNDGRVSGLTNRHGWYAPPFTTDSYNERIILIGDGFIEGTQVSIPETIGVQLDALLDADVMAMGTAGFGPAQYLSATEYALAQFNPDTIIIAVNLGDDLLNVLQEQDPRRAQDHVFYNLNADGSVSIEENSLVAQHFTDHYFNETNLPLWDNAIHTVRSHLLLPKVTEPMRNYARRTPIQEAVSREKWGEIDADYALRGFAFQLRETDAELVEQSTAILRSLLSKAHETAASEGVEMIFVGIPPADTSLNTDLPDTILTRIALSNNAPYLSLEADPALYTHTHGHWNTTGHRFYAEKIADYLLNLK